MPDRINEIIIKIQQNKLEEAEKLFVEWTKELQKENVEVISQSGYTFAQLGFVDYAKEIYTIGRHQFPNETIWDLLEGELAIDDGALEDALDHLLVIPESSPAYIDSLLLQADAYQMLGLPEVSFVKLQEANQLSPEQSAIQFGMAELKFEQGEFQDAIHLYDALLKQDIPSEMLDTVNSHYSYAQAWNGDFESASERLDAIPDDKKTEEQKEQLAFYAYQLEQMEKANILFDALYSDNQLSDDYLPLFAEVKYKLYEYDKSKEILDVAISKNPFQAPLLVQKAELEEKLGNYDAAYELLEEAIDLDPDYTQAHLKMLRLAVDAKKFTFAKQLIIDLDREDFVDLSYDWLKAKTFAGLEEWETADEFYDSAYLTQQGNMSFMEDYLMYLQEGSRWDKIGTLLERHPGLRQTPALSAIIETYEVWLNEQW